MIGLYHCLMFLPLNVSGQELYFLYVIFAITYQNPEGIHYEKGKGEDKLQVL